MGLPLSCLIPKTKQNTVGEGRGEDFITTTDLPLAILWNTPLPLVFADVRLIKISKTRIQVKLCSATSVYFIMEVLIAQNLFCAIAAYCTKSSLSFFSFFFLKILSGFDICSVHI